MGTRELYERTKIQREMKDKLYSNSNLTIGSVFCIHRSLSVGVAPWSCCNQKIPKYLCSCGEVEQNECVESADKKEQKAAKVFKLAICDECPYKLSVMQEMPPEGVKIVDADAHGYGDGVVLSWITEGARQGGEPILIHATGSKAELPQLFGQLTTPYHKKTALNYSEGYRKEITQRENGNRAKLRADHLEIHHEPKRPTLEKLDDRIHEWANSVINDKPTVLLFPVAYHPSRIWPAPYWAVLTQHLRVAGYEVIIISERPNPISKSGAQSFVGLSWAQIIALMQKSKLVIGADSAPAHVAGTLDIPTICIVGPTIHGGGFEMYDSVKFVSVSKDQVGCVGCYWLRSHGYQASICVTGCNALHQLHPAPVIEKTREMLHGSY